MKKRNLVLSAAVAVAGVAAVQNRDLLAAAAKLEKIQGDLFARVPNTGEKAQYLCKNDVQSEEVFKDWILYNGWKTAERVGEGFFFINDAGQTLTVERETILGGRYILWTASGSVE